MTHSSDLYRLLESFFFSSSASVKLQAARNALWKELDEREGVAAVATVFSTFSHYLPREYKRYRL